MVFKILTTLNFILLIILTIKFFEDQKTNFKSTEITTQRLTIVDSLGRQLIVLSNRDRQALPMMDGRLLDSASTEPRAPGILFFNEEGDEIGGIMYDVDSTNHYQLMTFDQRKNDQVLTLRKEEVLNKGRWLRRYGMLVGERGDKPLTDFIAEMRNLEATDDSVKRMKLEKEFWEDPGNYHAQRAFFGRTYTGEIGMFLYDRQNRPRLRIYVDSIGNPVIEKVDPDGRADVFHW